MLFLGEAASQAAAASFGHGYRTAMLVAAGLAVAGALVSLEKRESPDLTYRQSSTRRPGSCPTGGRVLGGGGSFMPMRKYSPVSLRRQPIR